MKKTVRLFIIISIVFALTIGQSSYALGCSSLKKNIIVKNISQLIDAVAKANEIGGNVNILLRNGVYDMTYLYETKGYNCFWIAGPNVTIRGISGNRDAVVVKGDAMSPNANIGYIFNVAGTNFTCENMTLKQVAYHAIQIHGELNVDNVILRNVHFMDTYQQMLKVTGTEEVYSDDGLVENCLFEYSAGAAPNWYTCGIDGHLCKNWIVTNTTVKNIISPDGNLTEPAIHFWDGSVGITVKNCIVTNCERGIYFGMEQNTINGGEIRNNFVDTMRDVSIGVENAPNTIIRNNICYTRNYPNSIEYRWPGTTNVQIRNNMITGEIVSRDGATASIIRGNRTVPLP